MTCPNCRARPLLPGRTLCHVCDTGPDRVDPKAAKPDRTGPVEWQHFDPAFRRTVDGLRDKFIDDEYKEKKKK